jgi:hypothetical protein
VRKRVINTTVSRLPVGGVTVPPGASAEVDWNDEGQELLDGGSLAPDNKTNRERLEAEAATGEEA